MKIFGKSILIYAILIFFAFFVIIFTVDNPLDPEIAIYILKWPSILFLTLLAIYAIASIIEEE